MFRRQVLQPCQKQPSTKTASCADKKEKSGLPGIATKCRRQPFILFARNSRATARSVERFPLDLTAAMISDRRRFVTISTRPSLRREHPYPGIIETHSFKDHIGFNLLRFFNLEFQAIPVNLMENGELRTVWLPSKTMLLGCETVTL